MAVAAALLGLPAASAQPGKAPPKVIKDPPPPELPLALPGAPRPPTAIAATIDGHPATLTRRRGPQTITEAYLIDRAGTRITWTLTAPLAADIDDARHALRLIAAP